MFTSHPKSRDRRAQKQMPFMEVRFPTLHLAFDMKQLRQVVPMPAVELSQTKLLGLTSVNQGDADEPDIQSVIVVDLHRKLYGVSLESPSHLLLFRANDGLFYGIPVDRLPEITAVAEDLLLSVDEMEDEVVMGITRQVIKVSDTLGEKTLFIVDADSLAQEVRYIMAMA